MVIRVYKLKKDGNRYRSFTNIIKVTKVEESDGKLYVHTYFSDNKLAPVQVLELAKVGIEVFVGYN